jgi:hypothetical protein
MQTLFKVIILSLLACWLATTASAGPIQTARHYAHPQLTSSNGSAIILRGTSQQIQRFSDWLDQIAAVPKGIDTMAQIVGSGHQLEIRHSLHALMSAGRTIAPMSSNLINGQGESVQIIFYTDIPDQGSHMVLDGKRQFIEYTAIQNLYHELAHAMHMMNGTWRYFKSEKQAIEEENVFRRDLALMQGSAPQYRFWKTGVLIGDVNDAIVMSEVYGPTIVKPTRPGAQTRTISSTGVAPLYGQGR